MRLTVVARCAVKRGNSEEEYEDAWCPASIPKWVGSRFRAAVADGATETSFSALWAGQLVRAWHAGVIGWRRPWKDLHLLQAEWRARTSVQPLPWYAEEKARAGAYSSLLGFSLSSETRDGSGKWHALAVGDSCLFHLRDGSLITAFPLAGSAQFGSRPFLLSSRSAAEVELTAATARRTGRFIPGDTFHLMTDALAAWYLRSLEAERNPQAVLDRMTAGDPVAFLGVVEELRDAGELRNDDVTLLTVQVQQGELQGDVAHAAGL